MVKFRGKTREGKTIYGSLISEGDYCWILTGRDKLMQSVIPSSVKQFVGYDYDGEECYEGDVLVSEGGYHFPCSLDAMPFTEHKHLKLRLEKKRTSK